MNSLVRVGFLAAACSAAACVVRVDSQAQILREEKRFVTRGTPELHLSTFDGSIEIRSADTSDVVVQIEKRGPTREAVEALTVTSSQEGSRVRVEVKHPPEASLTTFGFARSASAKLIVTAPRRTNVVARTGDGSIHLQGVEGRVELRTGDGAIRVADVRGDLVLNTGDGAITVEGAEGRLDLDTGDGGVNVECKLAAVKMHTGDGSIVYRVEPGARMSEDWDISTGDGSVALYLPASFNADLHAHTGDGSIRTELASSAEGGEDRRRDKQTLRAQLGEGGRRLRVQTGDGSISLRRR